MFRTPEEIQIASLRYVDGKSQDQVSAIVGLSQQRVSQVLSTFKKCFRQLGLDPNHPEDIRDAVIAMLRRAA